MRAELAERAEVERAIIEEKNAAERAESDAREAAAEIEAARRREEDAARRAAEEVCDDTHALTLNLKPISFETPFTLIL